MNNNTHPIKIVVVSDNHGRIEPLVRIREMHRGADAFIHCGDSELPSHFLQGYASVRGNNDFYDDYPEHRVVDLGDIRILVVHGHRHIYYNNYDLLAKKASSLDCHIVCFGHTHRYVVLKIDGIYLVNPGSLSRNRDGTGTSYAIIMIENGVISVTRHDGKE